VALHDVVLGATIDGYAVEGGFDTDDGPATSFGVAQAFGHVRPSVRTPGTFEHLEALVARAAQLGVGEVRLTVEWARIERRPGERDHRALEAYAGALRAAVAASLRTVVVLCDAAWPSWLGQEPWLSAWAPPRFASHARWVVERLEGLAQGVVTFRFPNAAARDGWVDGTRPPFRRRAAADAVSALDGMLVAHQQATEAIADVAPTIERALLFEVAAAYGDAELWRDVARGIGDAGALAARRRAWSQAIGRPVGARGFARRVDVGALRSTGGWAATPAFEWWLGGSDATTLSVVLQHADGAIPVVELGAGATGWDAQLATALPAIAAAPGTPPRVHLHGLVPSSGPLDSPVGLLSVAQHSGSWAVEGPDANVAGRLAGRVR